MLRTLAPVDGSHESRCAGRQPFKPGRCREPPGAHLDVLPRFCGDVTAPVANDMVHGFRLHEARKVVRRRALVTAAGTRPPSFHTVLAARAVMNDGGANKATPASTDA
jgi:hypothetical protein